MRLPVPLEHRLLFLAVAAMVTIASSGCRAHGPESGDVGEHLAEASMNFDVKNVRPFLQQVAPLIESGFGEPEIRRVESLLGTMKVKEEKILELPIRFRGKPSVLKIKILLDDADAADLFFFAVPELASAIDAEMKRFAKERGL